LVDGVRRSVADVIAPQERGEVSEDQPRPAVRREERPAGDIDARFDAARERLRSRVAPPPDDDDAS
jgi:hypothetical protein